MSTYATPAQGYGSTAPNQGYARPTIQQAQAQGYPSYQGGNVHEHRAPEAYVLSDTANESIPKDIRELYPRDDQGRVLFFTRPPIDTRHMITGRKAGDKDKPLAHTQEYLQAKEVRLKALAERKHAMEVNDDATLVNGNKRAKNGHFGEERDADGRIKVNVSAQTEFEKATKERLQQEAKQALQLQLKAVQMLTDGMRTATANEYIARYGDRATEVMEEDFARAKARTEDEQQRELMMKDSVKQYDTVANTKRMLSQNFWTGRFPDGTGRFEDDFDNRLPR